MNRMMTGHGMMSPISSHFTLDLRNEQNETAIRSVQNRGLLYRSIYAQKMREASAQQRMAAADILNGHLLMTEIMIANLMQKYIYDVYNGLEEKGMMRHQMKRHAKQMRDVARDLISRSNQHDRCMVKTFCHRIFPSLVDTYIEDGGTLTSKLHVAFQRRYATLMEQIYLSSKNVLDKGRVPESELGAKIQMVLMLCHTGIELYNLICERVDRLLEGFGSMTRLKSQHNEKILCSAKELMRLVEGKPENVMDEDSQEVKDARDFCAQFQKELTNEELLQLIESGIVSLQIDFTEYAIAILRIRMEHRRLSVASVRTLLARVGTPANVRRLLKEIASIPYTDNGETDAIDLAQSLPDSAPESAIATFRRLCVEDHVLLPEKEDERKVRCRELRQEVRANKGLLPHGTLKALYAEMKTKKAVSELLMEAGKELGDTLKVLDRTKVKELKA